MTSIAWIYRPTEVESRVVDLPTGIYNGRMYRMLLPILLFLNACAPENGADRSAAFALPPGPTQLSPAPFAGTPKSFNGTWTGTGRAYTDAWTQNDLSFRIYVGRTPNAADVNYDIREADGSRFSLGNFSGHYALGNALYASETKKKVGEIGEAGFYFNRPGSGRVEALELPDGHLRVSGYLEYGPTKIAFEAIVSL